MDRVSSAKRALVVKMATEQLIKKLVVAGVPKEEVDAMNREQRMEAWAGMIADGKDVLKASAAEASSSAMDLEREKLASAERQAAAGREAAARQAADDREERARRDAADREERREERREAAAAAARRETDDREERREAVAAAARQAAAEADERRAAAPPQPNS